MSLGVELVNSFDLNQNCLKQSDCGTDKTAPSSLDNNNNNNNNEDSPTRRDQWSGQIEFLLACLGNAVGLGNVWRFPYLCFKNGGGAFVIPYIVMVFLIGLPIFIIELSLGQYSSMGPAHLYENIAPIFKGVGLASIIGTIFIGTYYNMIIGWTLFYFAESLAGQRWRFCDQPFNTPNCSVLIGRSNNNSSFKTISSTEEFFNNYILAKSDGIEQFGTLQWKLALALFVAWTIVVLSLIQGIQTSGKVVYFTATFPYVILIILFVRGITLDGAIDGIYYYVSPDWSKIMDVHVWKDASIQVFYSFGIGGGGMLTYASYNRFRDPILKHTILIGMGDMLTSLFAGFVIFAMIGYVAHSLDKPIPQVVQSGTGLAFIVIPEGLSQMPLSMVWSLLFFTMLFLLGIDSQFAVMETLITYIFDCKRKTKSSIKLNKPIIVTLTGIIWFILGLPLCSRSGIYILTLMDNFVAGFPYLIIGFLEIFIIVYIYGLANFLADVESMTGWKPNLLFKSHIVVTISTIAPAIILYILYNEIATLIKSDEAITYGPYKYPSWAIGLGWGMALIPVLAIPCGACHYLVSKSDKNLCNHIMSGFKPTPLFRQNAEINSMPTKACCPNSIRDEMMNNSPGINSHTSLGVVNPVFILPTDSASLEK